MIAKVLPVILILLGIGGGVGAGLVLRPDPPAPDPEQAAAPPAAATSALALHQMGNQFMVPIVEGARVTSMVVMHIALEVREDQTAIVAQNEPRLRDRLLQVMFDHANSGGFDGMFTANNTMGVLRLGLLEAAQAILGPDVVRGVLITDILRSGA
jgi:flagellar protein FliL